MARPTKLTPRIKELVVQAIKSGNYPVVAARSAGIGESTFYRWLQEGEHQEEGEFREFRECVKKAEAEAEMKAVAIMWGHMEDNWQAAMTYLERRAPDRWRRRDADPTRQMSDDELLKRVGALIDSAHAGRSQLTGGNGAAPVGAAAEGLDT